MGQDKTVGLWSSYAPEPEKMLWPGWETVRLIGRGSFGAVYEIRRDMFGSVEKAALKVISIPQNEGDLEEMYCEGHDSESVTQTFREHMQSIVGEYSMMRQMSGCHHIVRSEDIRYIQHDDGIGWDIYIKMELLTPLMKAMPGNVSEQMVRALATDICDALVTCKEYGVIHRDIKPQNIFVSPTGEYKLGDFGIAKTVEKTMGGTLAGTFKFMAPEVFSYKPYGHSADIYSLGLVLYWLLNECRQPFLPMPPARVNAGMEEKAKMRRLQGEQLPPPAHGSEELKRIVMKACAYDPKDRYATAADMLRDLKEGFADPEAIRKQEEAKRRQEEILRQEAEDRRKAEEARRLAREAEEKAEKERRLREEAERAEQARRAKEKAERERLELEELDKAVALLHNDRTEEQDKTVVLTEDDRTVFLSKEELPEAEPEEQYEETKQSQKRLGRHWIVRLVLIAIICACIVTLGITQTGWKWVNGQTYYYRFFFKQTGWQEIDGKNFYFGDDGVMRTGLQKIAGKTYYFDADGKLLLSDLTGWQEIDGNTYYFGNDGIMRISWQEIAGEAYYFGNDGVMRTGLQEIDGNTYYFGDDGIMRISWQKIAGKAYYFGDDGIMRISWQKIAGKAYYFGNDGVMRTGLQEIDGNTYYFGLAGMLLESDLTGWQEIDGNTYYFDENGAMARGSWIIDGEKYMFGESGILLTKKQQ